MNRIDFRSQCCPVLLICALLLPGCRDHTAPAEPMGLKWVMESAEYRALCRQIYVNAWMVLKPKVLAGDRRQAVVFDVDETVLSNAAYQRELFRTGESYPYYWAEWVEEAQCPPISGAGMLIDSLRTAGVSIVYITNRETSLAEATLQNLKNAGLWQEVDILLCRRDSEDGKEVRREEVRTGTGRCADAGPREILALFGDQAADFEDAPSTASMDAVLAHYESVDLWGRRYFVLPNPLYGYWERGYR